MAKKTLTNYTPGARGINMKDGTTLWVDPGQSVDVDDKNVVGELPDFGTKPSDDPAADQAANDAALAAAKSEIADLKTQVDDLTKQLSDATAPK